MITTEQEFFKRVEMHHDNDNDNDNNPIQLVPTRSDHDIAKELREQITEAAKPIIAALNKTMEEGFVAQVQFGMGPYGKMIIQTLIISKQF